MDDKHLQERAKLSALMRDINENWEEHVAREATMARLIRMKFDQFVMAGFTPEQALILVKP